MVTEKSSEMSKDNTDAGAGSGKPKTVPPDLLKDIKGKNTTRDEIDVEHRFL